MASKAMLVGRLVRAEWQDAEDGEREDTCVIIEDGPAQVLLFPLGTAARGPGRSVFSALPVAALVELRCHPWVFTAIKTTRRGNVLLLARGRQYRLVESRPKLRRLAEPMRAAGRQRRPKPRRRKR